MSETPRQPDEILEQHDDGLIGRVGRFVFGRSWRSAAVGIAGALLIAAPAVNDVIMNGTPLKLALPQILTAIVVGSLGRVVKDDKATGLPGQVKR